LKDKDIDKVIEILRKLVAKWKPPIVTQEAKDHSHPFRILISCMLSLRTKDEVTSQATQRLFSLADTPKDMLKLTKQQIEKAIYPVGFYRNKAKNIKKISRQLVENYHSCVPDEIDELLKFPGVGRKTANLVVTIGYKKPGICVDTHVHRISNRWGYTRTRTPKETEFALRKKLHKNYWIEYNNLLVNFGRYICRPISPLCSSCPLRVFCDRVGVRKTR